MQRYARLPVTDVSENLSDYILQAIHHVRPATSWVVYMHRCFLCLAVFSASTRSQAQALQTS